MSTSVTAADLGSLIEEIARKEDEKEALAEQLKEKNKELASLNLKASGYLNELGWTEFTAPSGKIKIIERWNIVMPKTPEDKAKLFDWMRERGIYDTYATVQANSLKSLFMREREAALESGEGDPITWALPGMEPAKVFEDLDFKPTKK